MSDSAAYVPPKVWTWNKESGGQFSPGNFRMFSVLPAADWHNWNRHESTPGAYRAPNPPGGATISYYLQHRTEVDAYLQIAAEEEARVLKMIDERSDRSAFRERLLRRMADRKPAG